MTDNQYFRDTEYCIPELFCIIFEISPTLKVTFNKLLSFHDVDIFLYLIFVFRYGVSVYTIYATAENKALIKLLLL